MIAINVGQNSMLTPTCVGINDSVISCIHESGRGAVKYLCCRCRGESTDTEGHTGLLTAFGQLMAAVAALTQRATEIAEKLLLFSLSGTLLDCQSNQRIRTKTDYRVSRCGFPLTLSNIRVQG